MEKFEIDYYIRQADRKKLGLWPLVRGICIDPFFSDDWKRKHIQKYYGIPPMNYEKD